VRKQQFILRRNSDSRDEYPGDGLRLVGHRWAAQRPTEVCDTDLLRYLGYSDLREGDTVTIEVTISRVVPSKETAEVEP
jgi:hypothetical protein